jgi:succinyl-CoA synthetase beta subunit
MRLLEYQGKELFNQYDIRTPLSFLASNIEDAKRGAQYLGYPFVLKSQLTVGGRGKAGAIQKCREPSELEPKFNDILNKEVKGELPRGILLEKMVDISKELYLSIFLNRSKRCFSIIASSEGGVDIEQTDNKVIQDLLDNKLSKELADEISNKLKIPDTSKDNFINLLLHLFKLVNEKEAELAEINPLAILNDGSLIALDSKVIIDDNSLFRHEELKKYLFMSELEKQASKNGFSFVELDGDIAIIGNGAGLVMSTLDMVSDAHGKAGSFLDFGGKATSETIYKAIELISELPKIRAILVNLFGGIVRTDLVAQGILDAYRNNIINVPVFARISGAESEKAKQLLRGSRAKLFDTVEEAINEVVLNVNNAIKQ